MITTQRRSTNFLLVLALSAGMLMTACNAATIVSYINSALQIALEFLPLAVPGLPPQVPAYFTAGLQCIDFASTEVASTDTNAVKSAKITAQCASLVQANLPPGTPQNIVSLASKLATRIADLLAHLPATPPAPGVVAVKRTGKPVSLSVTAAPDVAQLKAISQQAKSAQAMIKDQVGAVRKP